MINEPKEDPTSMEHIGSRGRQKNKENSRCDEPYTENKRTLL
jgi:hypothetical protein